MPSDAISPRTVHRIRRGVTPRRVQERINDSAREFLKALSTWTPARSARARNHGSSGPSVPAPSTLVVHAGPPGDPIEALALLVLASLVLTEGPMPKLASATRLVLFAHLKAVAGVQALVQRLCVTSDRHRKAIEVLSPMFRRLVEDPKLGRYPELFFARFLDVAVALGHPIPSERHLDAPSRRIAELMLAMLDLGPADRLLDPFFCLGVSASTYLQSAPEDVEITGMEERPGRAILGLLRARLYGRSKVRVAPDDVIAGSGFERILVHSDWGDGRRATPEGTRPRKRDVAVLLEHLERLRPGGRLVALCGLGVLFRQSSAKDRHALFTRYAVDEVVILPGELFRPPRRAIILSIRQAQSRKVVRLITPDKDAVLAVTDQVSAHAFLRRVRDRGAASTAARDEPSSHFYEDNPAITLLNPNGAGPPPVVAVLKAVGIPVHLLGECVEIIPGQSLRPTTKLDTDGAACVDEELLYLRIGDITTKTRPRAPPDASKPSLARRPEWRLHPGDLLLTLKTSLGLMHLVDERYCKPAVVPSDAFVILRRRTTNDLHRRGRMGGVEVSMEYLQALLAGRDYQGWLRNRAVGATKQTRIRLDDLRNLPIPVPPRRVQEQIVGAVACATDEETIEDILHRLARLHQRDLFSWSNTQ